MSNMVNWAKSELDRLEKCGGEMQQEINKDILAVVELFANQGHSGFSASYALGIIKRLLDWKPIQALTGEDDEWGEVAEWNKDTNKQQNKRCSAVFRENFDNATARYIDGKVFSEDGGRTWFSKGGRSSESSSIPVTFPFEVPEKPEYIILNDMNRPEAIDSNE